MFNPYTWELYNKTQIDPGTLFKFDGVSNSPQGTPDPRYPRYANHAGWGWATTAPLSLGTPYFPICWHSGPVHTSFGGSGSQSQGVLVMWTSINNNSLMCWNPNDGTGASAWRELWNVVSNDPPAGWKQGVLEYSPSKGVVVVGGGDGGPGPENYNNPGYFSGTLTRCNMLTGAKLKMPPCPIAYDNGQGLIRSLGIENGGQFVHDSRTGNFILINMGQTWELNPDGAGTWTRKADMLPGMLDPDQHSANRGHSIVVDCSGDNNTHNVIVYVDTHFARTVGPNNPTGGQDAHVGFQEWLT